MSRAFTLLFVVAIGLPLAANFAGADGADPGAENREMAPLPHWDRSWRSLVEYPTGFERWFEDHFGFRARLVRWYGQSRLYGLRVSPSSAVVRGQHGWLFYADDESLADYTNERPMTPQELGQWRRSLERQNDWLNQREAAYLFTVAPDKHVMYPEEMPTSVSPVGSPRRMDQLFQALQGTGVQAIDLRAGLLAAKQVERIYHQTDTHWNDRGAFVAYQQIIGALAARVPAVGMAWTREDFEAKEVATHGLDLAGMIGLTRVLRETDLRLIPTRQRRARVVEPAGAPATEETGRLVTEIDDPELPRALIFRDSFASALVPFLSEHFSRAVYLWQDDFDAAEVLNERPRIVIQEIVGRHLYSFLPSPELVPK